MKYLPFILKHLRRNWIRTTSTVLAMAVCIFLFCTLESVLKAVSDSTKAGNVSLLVVRHAVSLVFNLPLSYEQQLAQVPGVKRVAISSWFGGSLPAKKEEQGGKGGASGAPDFSRFFPNLAVEAEPYFALRPEYVVPGDQMQDFLQDQRGCVIGRGLAQRFGWKPGDTFFLESFIPPYRKSSGPFEFVVRAVYDADRSKNTAADDGVMFFHFKYLYEGVGRRIAAGTYVVELEDPARAGEVAKAIDERFANSEAETKTETEAAFRASFIAMAGNLALLLRSIGLAVTFTILLVTANTMSMAVRERRTEIAVLKTLGFTSRGVMGLILAEALSLGALGGLIGFLLSLMTLRALPDAPGIGQFLRAFPGFGLSPLVGGTGLGLALTLGFVAGFFPALLAYRSRIAETLRQV